MCRKRKQRFNKKSVKQTNKQTNHSMLCPCMINLRSTPSPLPAFSAVYAHLVSVIRRRLLLLLSPSPEWRLLPFLNGRLL